MRLPNRNKQKYAIVKIIIYDLNAKPVKYHKPRKAKTDEAISMNVTVKQKEACVMLITVIILINGLWYQFRKCLLLYPVKVQVDDVEMNIIGTVIGYLFFVSLKIYTN